MHLGVNWLQVFFLKTATKTNHCAESSSGNRLNGPSITQHHNQILSTVHTQKLSLSWWHKLLVLVHPSGALNRM